MKLTFSPVRGDDRLVLSREADILIINGEAFDFSALPEGATLPRDALACDWIADDVVRSDGVLHVSLILPHGPVAPRETLFPAPILLIENGPVVLPAYEVTSDAD